MTKAVHFTTGLALLLLLPFPGYGQPLTADQVFQTADSLRDAAQYDSSTVYFLEAARLFGQHQNRTQQARVFYKISFNKTDQGSLEAATEYLEQGWDVVRQNQLADATLQLDYYNQKGVIAEARARYEEALRWYRKGLELVQGTGAFPVYAVRISANIGDVLNARGKYREAIEQLGKAQTLYHRHRLDKPLLLSKISTGLGTAHQQNGQLQKAQTYYKQALQLDQQHLPTNHPDLAKDYNNLAIIYYYQSDYQRALDYFKNSARVLASFYGKNHRLVAAAYNNIGVVYSEVDDPEHATEYMKKALNIKEKVLGRQHPEIAIGYQNLGAIHSEQQQYDEAITYYKKAEAIHLQNHAENHPELANLYANLGQAYASKEQYQKALEYYRKDLDINLPRLGNTHPSVGDTYRQVGQTYAGLKDYGRALDYYQKALEIFIRDYNPENDFQPLPLDRIVYPAMLLKTVELKAEALKQYSDQSGDTELLARSMRTYLQATRLVQKLQQSYSREGSKFLLRKRTADLYKRGFETAYLLWKETENPDYKEFAFYFVEQSKHQILLAQLEKLNARQIANIPDSLLSHEQALRSRLTDLQSRQSALAENPQQSDSLNRSALQDSLFETRYRLQQHIDKLESRYPRYYKLKYNSEVVRIGEVRQSLLAPGQAMISYFFGEDHSLYALAITQGDFAIRKLSEDSLLSERVQDFRAAIVQEKSVTTFAHESHRLYQTLLAPLSNRIGDKKLLIIPDGPLHYFPFESLLTESVAASSTLTYSELPYLLQKRVVSYAPSAEYLQLNRQRMSTKPEKKFVGFAPKFRDLSPSEKRSWYPGYNRPLSPLPLSRQEVTQLGNLFNRPSGFWSFLKAKKKEADLFVGERATEAAFKELPADRYEFIHLATHSFVSEEHPGQSGILFTAGEEREGDAILTIPEIYNLRLNARLVTLSACDTGIGSIAKGEGMISLSRAFQYAGARNLLVSLWNVDDRSTARLMVDFYKRLKKEDIPTALTDAKLKMIHDKRYAHPQYWAPFVFIGR